MVDTDPSGVNLLVRVLESVGVVESVLEPGVVVGVAGEALGIALGMALGMALRGATVVTVVPLGTGAGVVSGLDALAGLLINYK
jgi:hypothetical protein